MVFNNCLNFKLTESKETYSQLLPCTINFRPSAQQRWAEWIGHNPDVPFWVSLYDHVFPCIHPYWLSCLAFCSLVHRPKSLQPSKSLIHLVPNHWQEHLLKLISQCNHEPQVCLGLCVLSPTNHSFKGHYSALLIFQSTKQTWLDNLGQI